MFCAFLGHTGERLQDHWSSGIYIIVSLSIIKKSYFLISNIGFIHPSDSQIYFYACK